MNARRPDVPLVNREDMLALLEDGPKDSGTLAEWFGHPPPRIIAALRAMGRDGQVKRVGSERRWALAGYVAPVGRKPSIDHAARHERIRQALAGGPLTTGDLVSHTGFSRKVVKDACALMAAAGAIKNIGHQQGSRWVRPDWVPPTIAPVEAKPPRSTTPKKPKAVEDLAWWTKYATPESRFEDFTVAAAARDAEMRDKSAAWRQQNTNFS
jgi:hypothetical protein